MDTSTFDPTRAVVFDLNRGQVSREGGGALLLLPSEVLASVCSELDAGAVRQFGVALGKHAGARLQARLGRVAPSLEVMVDQLAGELSLAGLGSLSVERWGQALVVRIEDYALGAQGQDVMGGYIEGVLHAAVGRDVTALLLERTGRSLRLLLCNPSASVRVKSWLAAGGSWGDALSALHQSPKNDVVGGRS